MIGKKIRMSAAFALAACMFAGCAGERPGAPSENAGPAVSAPAASPSPSPSPTADTQLPPILYTPAQKARIVSTALDAGIKNTMFVPTLGIERDFPQEVRQSAGAVQIVYPHFTITASPDEIKPGGPVQETTDALLPNGPAQWVKWGDTQHLLLRLNDTRLMVEGTAGVEAAQLEQVAASMQPLVNAGAGTQWEAGSRPRYAKAKLIALGRTPDGLLTMTAKVTENVRAGADPADSPDVPFPPGTTVIVALLGGPDAAAQTALTEGQNVLFQHAQYAPAGGGSYVLGTMELYVENNGEYVSPSGKKWEPPAAK